MAGKKKIKKHFLSPDVVYNDLTVAKFINHIMKGGKKTIARKVVYGTFDIIKEKTKLPKLSQFVVLQEMRVFHNDESHLFWTISQMGKAARRLYGELGGKPINLRCELTHDSRPLRLEDAYLITLCEWDHIEEVKGE